MDTYKTAEEDKMDRRNLGIFAEAINALPSQIKRDECRMWHLAAIRGYVSTWGDDESWLLMVGDCDTPRKWTNVKKRLGFCELTQDGDQEGVFRVRKLPNEDQAAIIREVLGIRQKMSPTQWAHLSQWRFKSVG